MKSIFNSILQHPEITKKPPILIDIGASGGLPAEWKTIARYSICIAFDADTRDFSISESNEQGYKKLYSLNRLVAEKSADQVDFYLTRSPHCSSALQPDNISLKSWAFSQLFDVKKIAKMPAVDLNTVLTQAGFDYIDWYKTDSQGTDLRIFDALGKNLINKIIISEFEPGIINAYLREDKFHQLMAYMDEKPFWVSHMQVKGSQRISQDDLGTLNTLQRRSIDSFLKMSPGWCEISYINNFDSDHFDFRDYLLGWVFSTIKYQHGFSLHLAKNGWMKFHDPLFEKMLKASRVYLSNGYLKFGMKAIKKILCL